MSSFSQFLFLEILEPLAYGTLGANSLRFFVYKLLNLTLITLSRITPTLITLTLDLIINLTLTLITLTQITLTKIPQRRL